MRFCLLCFIKLYLKSNRSPLPGLYLCIFCSSLLPEISFNWKITALQSCVGFCCSTWISYRHTYIPSLFSLPPTPPPPYPSRSTTLYVDHMRKYNPTFSPSLSTWAKCITFSTFMLIFCQVLCPVQYYRVLPWMSFYLDIYWVQCYNYVKHLPICSSF